MTDPLDHIRKLAQEIGARAATRDGERRAADYIEQQLKSFGYVVKQERFRSVRSFSHVYVPVFLLAMAGFVFAAVVDLPAVGLLLSGVAAVTFIGETTTTLQLATAVVPKGKSQNVVARLAARELPRRRLVLSAHYDTAKSGLMWHPRLVRNFRRVFLVDAAALVLLPVVLGAQAVTHTYVFAYIAIPIAAVIAIALGLLLHREIFFKHVAGANDNASGVGVMLSLCEALAGDPPADTEVMAVATGSEEAGLVGMQKFVLAHLDDLERAWTINIDNVGAGQVSYTTQEGMLLRHGAGKELSQLAEAVAKLPGMDVVGMPFRTMSLDTEPLLLRRFDAITVIATEEGIPANWHWQTDTFDNIDPDSIDTAYRFVEAMVRRLIA